REEVAPVARGGKMRFRDARKFLADDIAVLRGCGAELVEIDLLVEVRVLLRAFTALGIARVIEAARRLVPLEASAARRVLRPGHHVRERLAGLHVEDVHRSILAAVFRER